MVFRGGPGGYKTQLTSRPSSVERVFSLNIIYFFLQILKKTTCIILKESEEEILHKGTLINQPDQTLKLNKIGIPFGSFMRLLTGTMTSYTEIPDASPQNYTSFTGNICSFLSQTFQWYKTRSRVHHVGSGRMKGFF